MIDLQADDNGQRIVAGKPGGPQGHTSPNPAAPLDGHGRGPATERCPDIRGGSGARPNQFVWKTV